MNTNTKNLLKGLAIGLGVLGAFAGVYYLSKRGKSGSGNNSKLKTKSPKNILFVGDSITAAPYSYANLIKKNNPDLSVDVLAKGGMPTKWMRDNLPQQLSGRKYDRIYIYGGVNDAWNDSIKPETTFGNLQAMVDMGNEHGADVFIITGYEPKGFMDYTKMPVTKYQKSKEDNIPLIDKYKNYQNNIPSNIQNASIVPKIDIAGMTADGIHPSSNGMKVIESVIIKGIKNV